MKYIDLYPQSEILTVQQNDLADNFCLDSYIQSKLTFAAYDR